MWPGKARFTHVLGVSLILDDDGPLHVLVQGLLCEGVHLLPSLQGLLPQGYLTLLGHLSLLLGLCNKTKADRSQVRVPARSPVFGPDRCMWLPATSDASAGTPVSRFMLCKALIALLPQTPVAADSSPVMWLPEVLHSSRHAHFMQANCIRPPPQQS